MKRKIDNVVAYLTPKSQVAYLLLNYTVRQALEKMKFHRYTSVPVIDKFGKYIGTLTEGDILWFLTEYGTCDSNTLETIRLEDIPHKKDNYAVNANEKVESLFEIAITQNFIPIVDDQNVFIGIVTRKSVLTYLYENNGPKEEE